MPISPDIIATMGGMLIGWTGKIVAIGLKAKQQQFEMLIKGKEFGDKSADRAAKRTSDNWGKITRRIIVMSVLFGCILGPFIASWAGVPIVMEVAEQKAKWFFGLFGGGVKTSFVQIYGYPMIIELRYALELVVGFYLGQGNAKA